MLRRSTLRGEVGTLRFACPDCSGGRHPEPGWRVDRFGRRSPCVTCGGRLEERASEGADVRGASVRPGQVLVRARKGRGWLPADAYTRAFVGSGETSAAPRVERWLCNVCHGRGVEPRRPSERCRACGGEGERTHSPFVLRGADPERVSDPEAVVESAISRRDEAGSFHELELCLAELRRRSPHRWRVFQRVDVEGARSVAELDEREARYRLEALRDLDALMPAEIRVPAYLLAADRERRRVLARSAGRWADARARAERDAEIRRLYAEGRGVTPEELAREFGVSRSTVYEAIHKGAA